MSLQKKITLGIVATFACLALSFYSLACQIGLAMVSSLILLAVLVSVGYCVIVFLLLRRLMLGRLSRLDSQLKHIRECQDFSARLELEGGDEFSALANAFNGMLDALMASSSALRQSEERLRLSLEGSQASVWDWDLPSGRMTFFHPWFEMLGYPPGSVDPDVRTLRRYLHPDDLSGLLRARHEHFTGRTPQFMHEHRLRASSGLWHWFLARGKVVERDAAGRPLRFIGTHIEITDRRQAQQELIRLNENLESCVSIRTIDLALANDALRKEISDRRRAEAALAEANRRKDEFLAMLAHELRNPLAPIRTITHLLRAAGPDVASQERKLEVIERQVAHMARLLDDLLDVSRITQGKIRIALEKADLCPILDNALETLQAELQSRELSFLYIHPESPFWLEGDPARLEQVFHNLLQNAAKYTEDGGSIRISMEVEAVARPAGARFAVVRIRDSGIGIEPELLPHIFDLFVQADRSLDRTRGGLGIGLTLVKRLIQMHGGTVDGFSEGLGRGSEFVVRLPLLAESSKTAPAWPVRAEALGNRSTETHGVPYGAPDGDSGKKVLLVEDNLETASSMAELLEHWGFLVRVAYDGPAGLEVAHYFKPQIILLDIGLPSMSGYEVARRLRQAEAFNSVTLVALTGYSQDEDRQQAMDAGIDFFCAKPVDLDELHEVLDLALIPSLSEDC